MERLGTLFEVLENPSQMRQITNFIEMYLVIKGVRPACLISLKPEQVERVRELLLPLNVQMIRYVGTQNFLIVNNTKVYNYREKIRFLRNSKELNPEVHRVTGEVLGYMTPFNIRSPPVGEKKDVDLKVYVDWDGKEYEIQIAPQRVVDKSNEDIQIYFGKLSNAISRLNEIGLPFYVLYTDIKIEPTRVGGGKRKTRRKRRV